MDINANIFNQLAAINETYINAKSFNVPRNSISANNYVNQAHNNNTNNLNLDLEDLSDKQNKKDFNSNSNNTNQQESFKISNNFYLNENFTSVNNNNELKLDNLDKRAISSKKNIRKESMPNLTFHDKKEFSQFIPYIMKRKFSVGQIKVRYKTHPPHVNLKY
jgi:hypothetical protein